MIVSLAILHRGGPLRGQIAINTGQWRSIGKLVSVSGAARNESNSSAGVSLSEADADQLPDDC